MNAPTSHRERNVRSRVALTLLVGSICASAPAADPAPLRAGMIGLDTSHVPAFAKIFNDPKATGDLAAIKVVVGYPGGRDIPASRDRVGKFTEQLRGMGVEIFVFMEAADVSKRQGGAPVSLKDVLFKARSAAESIVK